MDGVFYYGPQNFALPYNPGWTPGSLHTLNIMISPQLPFSINSRYAFAGWSNGGDRSHTIMMPDVSDTFTALFTPQYALACYVTPFCAGSINVTPPPEDGYYSEGTQLTFAQSPSSGWIFTGWQGDLSGILSPQVVTVSDEIVVLADYNTTDVPLTVTNLTPPMAFGGGEGFALSIEGTGFTSNSLVFVNSRYRESTFVSPTQLAVNISAEDIALAGAFPVAVSNFPSGVPCSAFAPRTFFVGNP